MEDHLTNNLVKTLPAKPGVYRMLDAHAAVLYVGKARDLRKRVKSYFSRRGQSFKIHVMMQHVVDVQVTVTHTESEALLLENNLIKTLRPRYNVLLRDDKSYPYIFISGDSDFPRLGFHRGHKRAKGRYFGPFPSASAVRASLHLIQKIFPVRQCQDSFFRNRSRPCLQYQIKRCTAPCVGYITPERYHQDIRHAEMFLEGKSRTVIAEMVKRMEQCSTRQDYEGASLYRDRIAALNRVQERQYISGEGGDADVLAAVVERDTACIEVTFIRGGRHIGAKTLFPKSAKVNTPGEILAAFLPQYYLGKPIPAQIYLNLAVPDKTLLERVFACQAGHKVTILPGSAVRGKRRRWIEMAQLNAQEALRRLHANQANLRQRFEALQEELGLEAQPERIECFDISHTQGEATVAACVVFDQTGAVKSDYRRFNIEGITRGDDYAAMRQALSRRYKRIKEGEGKLPDVLFIDGGKGQLQIAQAVLEEVQVQGVKLIAVAKGRARKPGTEQLFLTDVRLAIILSPESPALHLIQQIRDEAHRFALTGHRQRRAKARTTSVLEDIPGIGTWRRQALLKNFGGLREVARAGVEDLARVPGISPTLAQKIYDSFHSQE